MCTRSQLGAPGMHLNQHKKPLDGEAESCMIAASTVAAAPQAVVVAASPTVLRSHLQCNLCRRAFPNPLCLCSATWFWTRPHKEIGMAMRGRSLKTSFVKFKN
eukprot:1274319-Amphidinium_carterae.1